MHGEDEPQSEKIGPMLQSAYQLPSLKEESTASESYLGVVEHETRACINGGSTCIRSGINLLASVKLESFELGFSTINCHISSHEAQTRSLLTCRSCLKLGEESSCRCRLLVEELADGPHIYTPGTLGQ